MKGWELLSWEKYMEDLTLCQLRGNPPYMLWPVSALEKFSILAITSKIEKL